MPINHIDGLFKHNKGLYVISQYEIGNQKRGRFKIGMSNSSIFRRLDSYSICFPAQEGFWIYDIVIFKQDKNMRYFERKLKKQIRDKYGEIITGARLKGTEWFLLKRKELRLQITKFVKENQEHIIRHIRGKRIIDMDILQPDKRES